MFRVNSGDVLCIIEPQQLYYIGIFGVGTVVFTDATLTLPVLDQSFIVGVDNIIYNLDILNGEVGGIIGSC
jgi:hypothetical protein